jgi:hypothetical protein
MKKVVFSAVAILFAMQVWSQTVINESFEGANFPPPGWTNYPTAFTRNSSLAHIGAHSIGYTAASLNRPTYGIITPQFAGAAGQHLSFYIYTEDFYGSGSWYTSFCIKVSTTDNSVSSFSTVKEYSTSDYIGIHANNVILTEANIEETWYECTADLSDYDGQQIYVAIEVYDGFGCNYVQIDDIVVRIPPEDDISMLAITSPSSGINLSATSPVSFSFRNSGQNPVTSCDFQLMVDNVPIATELWTGDLAVGNTETYTFTETADLSAEGTYIISIVALLADDGDNSNDTATITVTNTICPLKTLPFEEHFNSETLDACWQLIDEDENRHNWQVAAEANRLGTGYGMYSYSYINGGTDIIAKNWLISPQIAIPANGAMLSFWAKNINPEDLDQLKVMISTTGTAFADFTQIWTGTPNDENFENVVLNLANYGNDSIYIAFYHDDEAKFGLYLDDIEVFEIEDCMKPMQVAANNITNSSATIRWHSSVTETVYGYEYAWSDINTAPDNASSVNMSNVVVGDTVADIQGLSGNITYYVWVRTVCDETVPATSAWTSAFSFTTEQELATVPYVTNFSAIYAIDNAQWQVFNDASSNTNWYIGSTTGAMTPDDYPVTDALYLSNNGGVTNSFNNSPSGFSFAYRKLDFTNAGVYTATYDYRVGGEAQSDYLRAFIVPDSVPMNLHFVLDKTTHIDAFSTINPAGWIALDGGHYLIDSITGTTQTANIVIPSTGIYNLVIFWANNAATYNYGGLAASVDNINIKQPTCEFLTNLSYANVTVNSADVSWITPATIPNDGYEYYISTSNVAPAANTAIEHEHIVADTIANLTDLAANTTYYVWARSICNLSNSEVSAWSPTPTIFTTPCNMATIPYSQNFDYSTDIPPCWSTFGSFAITNIAATSDPNTLRFGGQGTNVAVLPVFDVDVNTTRLSFVLRKESADNSGPMDIGYLTDMAEANSFVPVMTNILTVMGTTISFDTALSAFPAGIANIAFRQTNTEGFRYWLDDVTVYDPNCLLVHAFATQNLTATSADIIWTDEGESSTSWHVELFSTVQENPTIGGGDVYTGTATDTVVHLINLDPATTYYMYVKNNCGWANYSFTTLCMAITALPYTQNFDSYATGSSNPLPSCWTKNSTYLSGFPYIDDFYSVSTPNSLMLSNYNFGDITYSAAFLPEFGMPLNNLVIQFSAFFSYSDVLIDIVAATDPLDNSTWTLAGTVSLAGATETFNTYSFSLGNYQGSGTYIGFRNNSNGSFYLDNIKVSDCTTPTNLHTENLTQTSTDLAWSDLGQITNWTLKVSSTPLTNPTNEPGNVFDNPVTGTPTQNVENLTEETLYYVYLQNSCDTNWVTFTFTTPAACAFPTGLTATPSSTSTATLTWDALGMTDWNLKVSSTILTDPATESGDVFDGQVSGTPSQVVTGLTIGTTYYWYVQSNCGSAWADDTFVIQYCTPNPISVDINGGIRHVTFGIAPSVDQATMPPANAPFYNDKTNLIGGIFEGETTFSISVTQGYSGGYITKIWVDWNNDLIFDNVTELVAGPSEDVSGVQNFTATIPAGTPIGSYRLRIGSHDVPTCGLLIPCYEGIYGSYEDYTLQIVSAPIACPAPTAVTAIAAFDTATITWTENGTATQWEVAWKKRTESIWNNEITSVIPHGISGLAATTDYEAKVRAICGAADTSDWSVAATFTTTASNIPTNTEITANSLQLYPNPTTGELKIKNHELQEGDKIEIYNMLGQKQPLTTNNYPLTTINVSHLSPGIYTLKIGGYVGKFVKK